MQKSLCCDEVVCQLILISYPLILCDPCKIYKENLKDLKRSCIGILVKTSKDFLQNPCESCTLLANTKIRDTCKILKI